MVRAQLSLDAQMGRRFGIGFRLTQQETLLSTWQNRAPDEDWSGTLETIRTFEPLIGPLL